MAEFFKMPMLGQSMEEGTVVQWFKKVGDTVKKGEPLLEIMSDKANIEVLSENDGVLRKILADADATVPVHEPIAIFGTADENIDNVAAPADAAAVTAPAAEAPAAPAPAAAPVAPAVAAPVGDIAISPRARKLAESKGINIADLAGRGTGPDGRIVEADVEAYTPAAGARVTPLAAKVAADLGVDTGALGGPHDRVTAEDVRRAAPPTPAVAAAPAPAAPAAGSLDATIGEVIPFKGLRKMTADVVAKSRFTAPHITINMEVDMTDALALHKKLAPMVMESHNTKLTITDLLVKAVAKSLATNPMCNAALVGDEIRVYSDRNIGIAVATPKGLVVPVIRKADQMALGDISIRLKEVATRARDGKQSQDDLAGGTFTITNLGMFGVDSFDPILVPPQACILGVCRLAEKPLVVNGQVAVRSTMNFSLSFDHRVIDGVPAAKCLQTLKKLLEDPVLIFI